MPDASGRPSHTVPLRIAASVLLLCALGAAWMWLPDDIFSQEGLHRLVAPLRDHWWGPLASTLAMALLVTCFMPMTPLVATLVFAHGPTLAFGCSVVGVTLGAFLGHNVGRFLLADSLRQRLGSALPNIADQLQRRSLRPTLVLRLMPGFPFSLMNALAGSAGVPLRYFVAGTALTAVPIVAIMVSFSEGLFQALQSANPMQALWWVGGAVLLILAGVLVARRLRR